MINPESHKTRSSELTNPEVQPASGGCSVCGGPLKRGATKFCGAACYRVVQRSLDPTARFWAKVDRSGDGCWLWKASRSGGRKGGAYGQFTYTVAPGQQRHVNSHVYAYELANGPVPEGMEVMHKCHEKRCCRPSHLEAGTHAQNVKDSAAEGHYHVPRPRRQTVSDDDCRRMVAMRQSGMTFQSIADKFGVTKAYVSLLVKGKRRQYSDLDVARKAGVA